MPVLGVAVALVLMAIPAFFLVVGAVPKQTRMQRLAGVVVLLLGSVPASLIATLLLLPFWRWLEERWEIESVGHSGPSDWCFVAIYLTCLAAGCAAWMALRRRAESRSVEP